MKLNKIIYGILCLTTLNACSDQMEYKEYSNYGADYVKRTFGDGERHGSGRGKRVIRNTKWRRAR